MRNSLAVTLTLCVFSFTATAVAATPRSPNQLEATIASRSVTLDAPFELRLKTSGSPSAAPDFAPLERDFEILGVNQFSRMTIHNGAMDRTREWRLQVLPRRTGSLEIPAIAIAGDPDSASAPIPIEVSDPAAALRGGNPGKTSPRTHPRANRLAPQRNAAPAGADGTVFLEASVDEESPYVQGQVRLKVKIHSDRPLLSGSLGDPEIPGASIERVGDDRNFETTLGGRTFQVIEREFAVFPQRSGEIRIAPIAFEGQVSAPRGQPRHRRGPGASPFNSGSIFDQLRAMMGDDVFGPRGRNVQARSNEIVLSVRPRPEDANERWWLPAESLKLTEQWDRPVDTLEVGEQVTRSLVIQAFGVSRDQIPEIDLPDTPGFKQYQEPAADQTVATGEGLASIKVQKTVLIPTEPGEHVLPAVELSWWDTKADVARTAQLPERRITVVPGNEPATLAGAAPGTDSPPRGTPQDAAAATETTALAPGASPASPSLLTRVVGVLLAVAFAVALTLAVRSRRFRRQVLASNQARTDPIPSRRRAERAFERACTQGDPEAAVAALHDLGVATWPEQPPMNPGAFAERFGSAAFSKAVAELQHARFARESSSAWDGSELLAAYRSAVRAPRRVAARAEGPLPALYPTPPPLG